MMTLQPRQIIYREWINLAFVLLLKGGKSLERGHETSSKGEFEFRVKVLEKQIYLSTIN